MVSERSCKQKGRIDSLQALRALAFLGIFFQHSNFYISWAALGVSVFFVMSGFLMTYRYENVELVTSFRDNLLFSVKKIKKLYPLHVITMLFFVVLSLKSLIEGGITLKKTLLLIGEIGINVTLLQTWFYRTIFSFNGVAWFLSVSLFLYFIFPWIKRIIERFSIIQLCIVSVAILIGEIVACTPVIIIFGNDSHVYTWFMYCFPVFRVGDFFIGCVLKRLFFERGMRLVGTLKATIFEVLTIAITVFVYKNHIGQSNPFLIALHNWTTIYIPVAAMWVFLFASNKGIVTKLLTNKMTIFIGNISAYAFLIHYVVTKYSSIILDHRDIVLDERGRLILVISELAITIVLSVIYKNINEKHF